MVVFAVQRFYLYRAYHPVNLTDGLDGLSGNVCCVYFAVYFVVAYGNDKRQ